MNRLNNIGEVKDITEIRIRQGQLITRCTSSIWNEKLDEEEVKLLKNNLACLIIQDNLNLDLEITTNQEKWVVKASGTPVKSLLKKKTFVKAAKALQDLSIIVLEQILDIEGSSLITWQQLKVSRKRTKKGRKAAWYREIEEKVLVDQKRREVKPEFKTSMKNLLGVQDLLEKISTDKRKQEWIVFKESKNYKAKIGRIKKKKKNSVLIEHWENKENEEKQEVIKRCEGCTSNKEREHESCRAWQPKGKVLGAIPKNCINKSTRTIDFPIEAIVRDKGQQEDKENEWIFTGLKVIDSREIEILKRQNLNGKVLELIEGKIQELAIRGERETTFYTDGSLGKKEDKGIMGVGWVGIDRVESNIVSIGNLKVVNWPTSTKAELIGVWVVLLVVQCNTTVRVLTDSEQAIENINRACKIEQYSKWIRTDNRIILEKIAMLVKQKSIKLVLEKVKGHAEDEWNNEADRLAKEGRKSSFVLDLKEVSSANADFDIKWKSWRIENSVKCFVTKLTKRYNDAEWAYSRKESLNENATYKWKNLWQKMKKQRGVNCLSLKDSKNLVMQIKCLNNSLPTLSELKKRKPEIYKSNHCILCKEELPEDFDHLMKCSALQDSWEEIEEAVIETIRRLHDDEGDSRELAQKVKRIIFPEEEESKFLRRKELVIGLEEEKMIEDLTTLAGEKNKMNLWIDSILFVVQRGFTEVIWNIRCEKVVKWEKKEGITFKEKRIKTKKKVIKRRTLTEEEKRVLLAEKKKERLKRRVWVANLVDEAVENIILRGVSSWWSLL
jgi:ribonuclease HI